MRTPGDRENRAILSASVSAPPAEPDPRPSLRPAAVRLGAACLLTALAIAGIDVVATIGHPLAGVVPGIDVTIALMAAIAIALVAALLVAALAGATLAVRARLGTRRGWAAVAAALVLAAVTVALDRELLARRPAVWLLVAGATGFAIVTTQLAARGRRRVAAVLQAGAAIAALGLDAWGFRGVLPLQHAMLVLWAWALGVPAAWIALAGVSRRVQAEPRAWSRLAVLGLAAVLVFVVQATVALRDAPAGARLVLREVTAGAAATLVLARPLLELDGDGEPSWPAGGDCAPLDGARASSAHEQAGNGVDDNCLAGDAAPQHVDGLARALAGSPAANATKATRILLLTIDALRADAQLPELARRLGDRCVQAERAWSTNPETTFAIDSLFASRFPSQGRFTRVGPYHAPIDDPWPRLPALMSAAGLPSIAIAFHSRFDPRLGLTVGFDEIWLADPSAESMLGLAGSRITEHAIAALRERSGPFFAWVHHYDPHEPYLPHPELPLPQGTPQQAYLAEVAATDRELVRLLDALGPAVDELAIIVTADHGEAFGEHGKRFHATDLFEEQIRIPLWLCPPVGHPRPPTPRTASIIDIAPTVLDLAGIARPREFVGRSLLSDGAAPVFAEMIGDAHLQAAIAAHDGRLHKLVRWVDDDVRLLFDLDRDPGETEDRLGDPEAPRDAAEALLDVFSALTGRAAARAP
ncbi:MAG: sulfatase [Nannocystaceae bacterium]|nr:sulfatase [Nannocystaceae bacterium]